MKLKGNKYIIISIIVSIMIGIIFISVFKNTYAYDYINYDYTLFYKDDKEELSADIKKYIGDIDYIIYNNSDYSVYDNLSDNYNFMVNFAIDYIIMHKDNYLDKIKILESFSYTDVHYSSKITNEYIDIDTVYNITNKYFGIRDFAILNDNVNIIDNYISLSGTYSKKIDLEIDSIDIIEKNSRVKAFITYKNNPDTNYIYTFIIKDNVLKLYNVEVV